MRQKNSKIKVLLKQLFNIKFNVKNINETTTINAEQKKLALLDAFDLYDKNNLKQHTNIKNKKVDLPGIKGSNVLLFMKGFHNFELECGELKEIENGYQINVMSSNYAYYITANKSFEISSFQISLPNNSFTEAILEYCCELNYNLENSKETKTILKNQKNSETEAIIVGDGYFELSTDIKGTVFTIKAIGFDQYVNALLEV